MSALSFLIKKEFLQLRRNAFMPKLIVAMPLALMLVFPWAANQEVRNINVSVVDLDHSVTSSQLIHRVSSSSYFNLTTVEFSYNAAEHDVRRGAADVILEIEPDYEKHLDKGEPANLYVAANAVNGTKGSLGAAYLSQIVQQPLKELDSQGAPLSIETRYMYNPTLDYKNFMVPALMVMLITLLSGFLPALNIVSEKEHGTIEQINVSPVTRLEFILGKLIPYWIIGFFEISFAMTIAWLVYGLVPQGSLLIIYLFASLYILLISGFGLVISNYSDTMQQAMFVMFFFMLILLLMSGLFTPVSSMPQWAQYIAAFNPLKYFMEVMRLVYLKGCGLQHLQTHLFAIVSFAVVFNTWAIISYKKNN